MVTTTSRTQDLLSFLSSQVGKRDFETATNVRQAFKELDWPTLHSLLQKKITQGHQDLQWSGFHTDFSSIKPGEYYFNMKEHPGRFFREYCGFKRLVQWYFTGEITQPEEGTIVSDRIKILKTMTFESAGGVKKTDDISELLSFCDKVEYLSPLGGYFYSHHAKIYAPSVKLILPDRRRPIITSLGLIKGYWEEDDMCYASNRYEIVIGRNPSNFRVSMQSGNSGIPDGCK